MPLSPHLPFDDRETPLSFAARLAALHTGGRLIPFLRDLGIRPEDLRLGANDAVDRLADVAAVDPAPLRRNALRKTGRHGYALRGHAITAEFLASPDTVYCPACILADDAGCPDPTRRIGRLTWDLAVVRTCPEHGLALVRRPKLTWDDSYKELGACAPRETAALQRQIADAVRREVSPLQRYVTERLEGRAGPAWLDGETLENAVWTTEMLGLVLTRGPANSDLRSAHPDHRDRAGRAGFAFTARGEAGIREALAKIRAKHGYRGGKAGPQRVFGRLYTAQSSTKAVRDRGNIRAIMRRLIIETFEFPAGAVVLGEALPARRLHTAATLAAETGLDTRTLRGVLAACGMIPADGKAALQAVFDATEGRRIAAGVARRVSLRALPDRLTCTRPLAEQIADDRILRPLAATGMAAARRTGKAFDEWRVAALLSDIANAAPAVAAAPPDWSPLAKAAEKTRVRAVDVLHLVLGRHLAGVCRVANVHGVAGLFVDPAEVRSVSPRLLPGLAPVEAFGRLRLPVATGWALIDAPDGEPMLGIRRIPPKRGNHDIIRISEDAVSAFAARFVSIAHLATAHDMAKKAIWQALNANAVRPSAARPRFGIDLFDRRSLPPPLAG